MYTWRGQILWVFRGKWGYWVHGVLKLDSKTEKKYYWLRFSVSPAQVTEHHWVELKDQNISQETKDRFVKLKEKYPEVFSLNSQDIGHTNLVTMHMDTGNSPLICQTPYTLPLKHYSWVQQEIETLEHAGVIKKSINPWASSIIVVPRKSVPGELPRWRMCIDFRKIKELQPKTKRVDKTQIIYH